MVNLFVYFFFTQKLSNLFTQTYDVMYVSYNKKMYIPLIRQKCVNFIYSTYMYLFSLYLSIVQSHINQLKVLFDEIEFDLMCMNVL